MLANDNDLVFIRHGESLKNAAAQKYRQERNLPFCWETFVKDPYFLKTVTHNPDLIDCHLSPKGIEDCLNARKRLENYVPDLILVSPLQRALQTCSIIFKGRQVPRIVEPLISETFKHSSEICRSIAKKKQAFPDFDFSRVEAEGEFWFIKNDSLQNQKKYLDFLAKIESDFYNEKVKSITQFMESEKMHETRKNVRERAEKVKQLLKEYRKTYNRICIVSHFYTIQCLCAKEFTEDDEPKISIESHNGGSYETSVKAVCGP